MNARFVLMFVSVFLLGCKTEPFQYPKISYENTSAADQFVYQLNSHGDQHIDSIISRFSKFSRWDTLNCYVRSGEIHKFPETFYFSGPVWMRRSYKKLNRHMLRFNPDLRIISFSVDSTLKNYTIYLDTTVVNSKDSVYYFHSRE